MQNEVEFHFDNGAFFVVKLTESLARRMICSAHQARLRGGASQVEDFTLEEGDATLYIQCQPGNQFVLVAPGTQSLALGSRDYSKVNNFAGIVSLLVGVTSTIILFDTGEVAHIDKEEIHDLEIGDGGLVHKNGELFDGGGWDKRRLNIFCNAYKEK